jgi:hypothetical protein
MTTTGRPPAGSQPLRVTRADVSVAISPAFGSGAVHRDALIAFARRAGARPEVVEVLQRIPAYRYTSVKQVLEQLPRSPRA